MAYSVLLHGSARVHRESLDQRATNPIARGEVGRAGAIRPRRRDRRREYAVLRLRQRRVTGRVEIRQTRIGRLQDDEVRQAGHDRLTLRVTRDDRGPLLAAGLRERVRMRPAADVHAIPAVLDGN